jgi:hypothetical protein
VSGIDLIYRPPGPVAQAFMASRARVQIINGPIGSGKTTAALMKGIRLGQAQRPSTTRTVRFKGRDAPVRQFKLCTVRDTYRQLWGTTIQSWFKRIPRDVGEFNGAVNAPASHHVSFGLSDGSLCEFTHDFVAIGENAVEDVLRGYEPTAFYLNEADLLAKEVYTYARGRAGRFPDMSEGGPTWYGVLLDCNAPEFQSWLYQDIFTLSPDELAEAGIDLFRQPSGLSPLAENVDNLPPDYYANQVRLAPEWYIERMVKNRPGYSRAGRPVYPEFTDQLHVPGVDIQPVRGLRLFIGLDAGMSPAAVFGQQRTNGQWVILDEIASEPGTGAIRFAEALARRLKDRFQGFDLDSIVPYADPAAFYGADRKAGERDWTQIVGAKAGLRIRPAPTNKPGPRWEAVRLPLTRLIDGAPGLQLSPRCKVLRLGFNSNYRFRKITGEAERYDEQAEKNDASHPHDALQYLLSGGGEDAEIRLRSGERRRQHAAQQRQAQPAWDPYA